MRFVLASLLLLGAKSLRTSALPSSPCSSKSCLHWYGPGVEDVDPSTNTTSIEAREAAPAGVTPDLVHGWCGVHVAQYQRNEGPSGSGCGTSEYRLTVTLKDALQDVIGGVTDRCAPGGDYFGINSQLPYVFEVEVGGVDSEPVFFKYAGQAWNSNSGQCSVGGYAGGVRQMDCGFNC